MKLSKLIETVGDENVLIQPLANCLTASKTNRKGETTISFVTKAIDTNDIMYGGDKSKMIGLVVWIPRFKIPTQG
jgi:hypothetical protein